MSVHDVWMQSLGSRMPLREFELPKKRSKFKIFLLLLVLLTSTFLGAFHVRCGMLTDAAIMPLSTYSTSQVVPVAGIDYVRSEPSTYLAYPQWLTVYAASAYADALRKDGPSSFPYFQTIGQYWRGYCQVYGIASHYEEVDWRDNLRNMLTGLRISIEYGLEGAYEETLGRVAAAVSVAGETTEDKFAAQIAGERAAFLATDAWYQFPYGQTLLRLWRDVDLTGDSPIRKIERRVVLTTKYTVQEVAGLLMRGISSAVGEPPVDEVYAAVHNASEAALSSVPFVRVLQRIDATQAMIALPRREHFAETVAWLAYNGIEIDDLAGNDEILMSLRAPVDWQYPGSQGRVVFELPVLTQYATRSIGVQVPIKALSSELRQLRNSTATIENLYAF